MQGFIAAGDFQTSTHNVDTIHVEPLGARKKKRRYAYCDWALRRLFTDPGKKERMRQFSIYFQEIQTAKETHYIKIRNRRAKRRKQKSSYVGRIPYLYVPTILSFAIGCCWMFITVFPGFGELTFLKQQKTISILIAVAWLVTAVILLFITEGLKSRNLKKKSHLFITDEDEIEMWRRRRDVEQIPCAHIQPLQRLYLANGEKQLTNEQIQEFYTDRSPVTTSTTQTQTDEQPFLEYLDELSKSLQKTSVSRLSSTGSGTGYRSVSSNGLSSVYDEEASLLPHMR